MFMSFLALDLPFSCESFSPWRRCENQQKNMHYLQIVYIALEFVHTLKSIRHFSSDMFQRYFMHNLRISFFIYTFVSVFIVSCFLCSNFPKDHHQGAPFFSRSSTSSPNRNVRISIDFIFRVIAVQFIFVVGANAINRNCRQLAKKNGVYACARAHRTPKNMYVFLVGRKKSERTNEPTKKNTQFTIAFGRFILDTCLLSAMPISLSNNDIIQPVEYLFVGYFTAIR